VTTTTDLLQAILKSPADDAPRLMLADVLEEQGQGERADFIRCQVMIASKEREKIDRFNDAEDWSMCTGIAANWCPNCGDCICRRPDESKSDLDCPLHSPDSPHCCMDELDREIDALRHRERKLQEPDRQWWSDYGPGDKVHVLEWSRGFVSSIAMKTADFLAHAPESFRAQPFTSVRLVDRTPNLRSTTPYWFDAGCQRGRLIGEHDLPREIYRLLPDPKLDGRNKSMAYYDTEDDALAALSRACVHYGRRAAGLPALTNMQGE